MKLPMLILASLLLAACGGGGGGDAENANNSANAGNTNDSQNVNDSTSSTRMEDIVVSSDFNFVGGDELSVEIHNQRIDSSRYYVNICSTYRFVNGDYQIDYGSCALRTSLNNQFEAYALQVSPGDEQMLAQVVAVEAGAEPSYFTWDRELHGGSWVIELN